MKRLGGVCLTILSKQDQRKSGKILVDAFLHRNEPTSNHLQLYSYSKRLQYFIEAHHKKDLVNKLNKSMRLFCL